MGRQYAEYENKWAVYSDTTDSFITNLMTIEDLEKWRKDEYGRQADAFKHTARIDFDEAICNWINSEMAYDEKDGVVGWLKRNGVDRQFNFRCYLDKEDFYIYRQEEGGDESV